MDADLSDEEFLLPDTQLNFALKMPSLAQDVADAKLDSDRQHTGTCKHACQAIGTWTLSTSRFLLT